ncbi:P-loop containing nucleoside triphosphate hydrolase protein [Mycena galericulata]|nr:P-loop containing nucleoside triphosphate hydrolase protein [Mycena galericulata]
MNSIGGEAILFKPNVIALFSGEEKLEETPLHHVALQAWVAWRAATLPQIALRLCQEPRIDTMLLTEARLSVFSKLVRDASRLSALKPTSVENEIAEEYDYSDGHLHVLSTRFQNRVRVGGQPIEIQGIASGQQITVLGKATRVDGRAARIQVDVPFDGLIKVTTVGKDRLTTSEQQREKIVLNALQSTSTIAEQPFFQAIWLPRETSPYPARRLSTCEIPRYLSRRLLNDSQTRAVEAILSTQHIDVIHGPPGTGKTTVIAAAVTSMGGYPERTIWITAQSNVAVKNVAEKLAASDFWDFKILVSQGSSSTPASRIELTSSTSEFHHDWHEHLYEKINANLIKSEEFINDLVATEQQLMGSRVILCTLSMLSSLRISAIMRLVPLETVIVDEASQVEIGNFIPMISRFSKSLRKIVFIGDDKQCEMAPYGHDDISDLQSVFEMKHLREGAIFLDTQYFIGRHVYGNKLKTIHHDVSQCCHFINVKKGKEISKGLSWVNLAEVGATVAQARKLHARGQSYRIITPYDAQRAMIETALKASKPEVPWQDTVFCVDSFQGNEADWIIVSLVRTEKIGFLAEKRRVNVMLTRCKKGMKICTSRPFVEGTAKNTLIGLLASEIGPTAWER